MKAAILNKAGVFDIKNVSYPEIGADEVLIKVMACGICGSDLHAYKGLSPDIKPPIILGHEFAGSVAKKGRNVKNVKIGDRVCVEPLSTCGGCYFCKKGEYNRCMYLGLIGCQFNGAFAEYCSVNKKWLHKLPENISYEEGAMMEPLAVAVHNVDRYSGIRKGETAVIFGAGTVGNLVMQILKIKGISKVIVVDLVDWRLDLARKLGADVTLNFSNKNVVSEVLNITGGIGVDVVFEAAGNNEVLNQAIKIVRKGGEIILIGVYENPIVKFNVMDIVFTELILKGSAIYCNDFETAIQLASHGKVNLKPLISNVLSLDEIDSAFKSAIKKVEPTLKILIKP